MGQHALRTDRYRILLFIKRQPSLSYEEFSRHWLEVHSKLVIEIAKKHKGLIRYEQLHVNQSEKQQLENLGLPVLDYDGVALFDVESFETYTATVSLPEMQSLIVPDENRFFVRSTAFVLKLNIASIVDHDEDLIIAAQMGSASSAYLKVPTKLRKDRARMLLMFKRKEGMSMEEMTKYWLNEHAKVVTEDMKMGAEIIKYEQLHLAPPNPTEHYVAGSTTSLPDWDGVALIDVPSFDSFRRPGDTKILMKDQTKWQSWGEAGMFPVDVATIIDKDVEPAYEASLLAAKL
ncbi:hypothetical protein VNI00_004467 [Paramarasmius palmivorus]|uniref:EthD domain-containing protein n=1 Tax=Paramarasmius palmivorus TaxID=297713 RepID=A0AAW0DF88_9AGAR